MSLLFLKDDLLTIIEETKPTKNVREFYQWEVALIHQLVGYQNHNGRTCRDNVIINQKIWELDKPVKNLRRKYHL